VANSEREINHRDNTGGIQTKIGKSQKHGQRQNQSLNEEERKRAQTEMIATQRADQTYRERKSGTRARKSNAEEGREGEKKGQRAD